MILYFVCSGGASGRTQGWEREPQSIGGWVVTRNSQQTKRIVWQADRLYGEGGEVPELVTDFDPYETD